ncbi:MAG: hypothetical protein ACE5GK_08195 [Nitrospiria bacterium]
MDYEISISEDKSHVYVRVYKPITRALAFEFNRKMVVQAQEYGIDKFLFDVRDATNVESTLNNYLIAYEDAEKVGFTRSEKFAVVHSLKDKSHDFIMTVARNAGYNLRLFTHHQDALEWLHS